MCSLRNHFYSELNLKKKTIYETIETIKKEKIQDFFENLKINSKQT